MLSSIKTKNSLIFKRGISYGFIGCGRMGIPMASNLRRGISKDNDVLTIFDVNKQSLEVLKNNFPEGQIQIVNSISDLVKKSEIIITMLPGPAHIKTAYNEINQTLKEISPIKNYKVFIDSSTIDPQTTLEVGEILSKNNNKNNSNKSLITFFDAPVSGGVLGATNGTLTFMVGAPEVQPENVDPVPKQLLENTLKHMGKRIVYCGKPSSGIVAKLCNNYALAVQNIAICEALNLGKSLGLDPKVLASIMNTSTAKCWSGESNNPVPGFDPSAPASKDYTPGFSLPLIRKDIRLAIETANSKNIPLPVSTAVTNLYSDTDSQTSTAGKDFSAIYAYLESITPSKDNAFPFTQKQKETFATK